MQVFNSEDGLRVGSRIRARPEGANAIEGYQYWSIIDLDAHPELPQFIVVESFFRSSDFGRIREFSTFDTIILDGDDFTVREPLYLWRWEWE